MKQIKTLIFTTNKDHQWLKDHEAEIVTAMGQAKNVKIEPFAYRYTDAQPVTYTDKEGKVRISQDWFDRTFTEQARAEGFTTAVFHFTRKERRAWGIQETINGSYFRDPDDRWEFWVCADKGQRSTQRQVERLMSQYVRVFIHEYGHGFIHWFHPDRREDVHTYDYDKKNIKSLFATIDGSTSIIDPAPVEPPKPPVDLHIDHRYKMNNYWTGNEPISIVLHTTGGRGVVGAVETLLARGLSYNFIIDKGQVYQLVDWSNSAWHAGVKKSPNLRAKAFYGDANPNKKSVGIAFTYPDGDIKVLPDSDVDACVKLIKFVGQESNNRYNADNIFAHKEITIDKPEIVLGYRQQVLDALVGDKDPKDAQEKTRLMLMIQLLQLKIKLLLLRNKQ